MLNNRTIKIADLVPNSANRSRAGRLPVGFSFSRSPVLAQAVGMGIRRQAREKAVQFLFQQDLNTPDNVDEALESFWLTQRKAYMQAEKGKSLWGESAEIPPPDSDESAVRLFAEPLIRGVIEKWALLDGEIAKHAKNWSLHRIAAVDRSILRLAIYELLFRDDIPPVVSINEAIDIAKRYSTDESGKFVNGILDRVKADLMRPSRTAAGA